LDGIGNGYKIYRKKNVNSRIIADLMIATKFLRSYGWCMFLKLRYLHEAERMSLKSLVVVMRHGVPVAMVVKVVDQLGVVRHMGRRSRWFLK
jgi:hypothetical protein